MKSKITMIKITIIFTLFLTTSLQAAQFNVMLFTKTAGWHHKSINQSVSAFEKMSKKYNFDYEWHEDATRFNDENLEQFDVIVFLLTTGDILN
ncbi:MAG: ThuA domain-containing protein, partial [Paraglaciecola chathamensis]